MRKIIFLLLIVLVIAGYFFFNSAKAPDIPGLPKGFPADVYIHEGAEVVAVVMAGGKMVGDKESFPGFGFSMPAGMYWIELQIPGEAGEILNLWKQGMQSKGWEEVKMEEMTEDVPPFFKGMQEMMSQSVAHFKKGEDRLVQIMIMREEENKVSITLQHCSG